MKKYRKKPVVVEAVQWTGQRERDGADEARLAWNTRAPILSSREMEMLDESRSD